MTETTQRIVKMVQELLLDEDPRTIGPALIDEKIDLILKMSPRWGDGLDRRLVADELIRRFSLWIGEDTILKNDINHVPWLLSGRKTDWRYWQRYREWLEMKMSVTSVDALDRSTDEILGLLEDPLREGGWDRRGMVVGHVQSGKTGNYTGLICKAADAGYKIIIVLAGLHNNLRSQTQMRLDEGFLGYETRPSPEDVKTAIGVGRIDGDPAIRPNYVTNRTNNGDFSTARAATLGITPEERPWLFVVKKNKTVLERLERWISNHVANLQDPETGRRIVTNLPLLLIDDEADHASVDTGEQIFDADGRPDAEHQPTAINRLTRRILNTFTRSAYVGYTATPFANIFIHERGATRAEGPDLFPAAFIINLAAPSNYIGPSRVFGLQSDEGRVGGLPLVRVVRDFASPDGLLGWMPVKHKNGHRPVVDGRDALPASLERAIDAFVLTCAIRHLRGQGGEHSSMLIHVTRFNAVQQVVHRQVAEYVRQMRQRISRRLDDKDVLERLEALWLEDFVPTSAAVRATVPEAESPPPDPLWTDILAALPDCLADIDVRMINGTAKDALDYADQSGAGLKVIAIGGDKLSRGLTLEGLCTSYFLRASKMYDTLMQMGRWFGYRPGYIDLCRLYTATELVEWFGHIADAAEELREEFDMMASTGGTPRDYGLKVQSHPVLMVTSRLKMRAARNLMLSFSGQLLETVALFRDRDVLGRNVDAAKRLVADLTHPAVNPVRRRNGADQTWTGYLWEGVAGTAVVDFLTDYRTHPDALKVNSRLLADFISAMMASGELTHWTVAFIGGGQGAAFSISDSLSVSMLKRTAANRDRGRPYSIGRLLSPRDESIDLDEAAWAAALDMTRAVKRSDAAAEDEVSTPNGPSVRRVRGFGAPGVDAHPDRGLLLLYALDPVQADGDLPPDSPPVIAFGISFPGSDTGTKVEYLVNNVLWEQEYGASE